jgi:hypothetical protein
MTEQADRCFHITTPLFSTGPVFRRIPPGENSQDEDLTLCRRTVNAKGYFMNKKVVFPAMLVSLLAFGLAFVSCDNGTGSGGTGDESGTFRIKITGIPSNVMAAGQNGQILIGLYLPNTTSYSTVNALAGRDTSLLGDDDSGSDWYEFSMYTLTSGSKFVGAAGNYDIAFTSSLVSKVLKNTRLEVYQTNTVSYSSFVNPW